MQSRNLFKPEQPSGPRWKVHQSIFSAYNCSKFWMLKWTSEKFQNINFVLCYPRNSWDQSRNIQSMINCLEIPNWTLKIQKFIGFFYMSFSTWILWPKMNHTRASKISLRKEFSNSREIHRRCSVNVSIPGNASVGWPLDIRWLDVFLVIGVTRELLKQKIIKTLLGDETLDGDDGGLHALDQA